MLRGYLFGYPGLLRLLFCTAPQPGVVVAFGRWNVVGIGAVNGSNVAFPGVVVEVGRWNVVGVGLLNGSNVAFPRGEKKKISSNPRYCTL